jgi:ATP-dependent protease HslVU (ClpYQ) peptidase subunit
MTCIVAIKEGNTVYMGADSAGTGGDFSQRTRSDSKICHVQGGFATKESEAEVGGQFLVAYEGRIFQVYSDYQVAESSHNYEAVGCGSDIAMGSLHTTLNHSVMYPESRVRVALEAAEEFSAGVRGPFVYGTQTIEIKESK